MDYRELGIFIRAERKKRHFTQEDLAKLAGVTGRTIKSIEGGMKTHINTLRKVMKILGYKVNTNIQITLEADKD